VYAKDRRGPWTQKLQKLNIESPWQLLNDLNAAEIKPAIGWLLAFGRCVIKRLTYPYPPNAPWNFRGDFIKGLILSFNIQNIEHNFVMDVSMVKHIL